MSSNNVTPVVDRLNNVLETETTAEEFANALRQAHHRIATTEIKIGDNVGTNYIPDVLETLYQLECIFSGKPY